MTLFLLRLVQITMADELKRVLRSALREMPCLAEMQSLADLSAALNLTAIAATSHEFALASGAAYINHST